MRAILLALGLVAGAFAPAAARLPVAAARIVHVYPHAADAFTEGLFFRGGHLFESTGLEGLSYIREVRLEDGRVLRQLAIPPGLFGEGIVDVGNELVSLTWQGGQGFRWSLGSFKRVGQWHYPGEGWALTKMPAAGGKGQLLVMSDGTASLRLLDPVTLAERRRLRVTADGEPVNNLNELEFVRGEILANVWHTDLIARINPGTGAVKGFIDLSGLPRPPLDASRDGVANGIAYDAKGDRLFVTGKNWPQLYQIQVLIPGSSIRAAASPACRAPAICPSRFTNVSAKRKCSAKRLPSSTPLIRASPPAIATSGETRRNSRSVITNGSSVVPGLVKAAMKSRRSPTLPEPWTIRKSGAIIPSSAAPSRRCCASSKARAAASGSALAFVCAIAGVASSMARARQRI